MPRLDDAETGVLQGGRYEVRRKSGSGIITNGRLILMGCCHRDGREGATCEYGYA